MEYDKKDKSGKVTEYWRQCKRQIVAYRKQEGYLIKFEDRIPMTEQSLLAGWSDWITDLHSRDVCL